MSFKLGGCTHTYLFTCSLAEAVRRLASLGLRYVTLTATPPHIWPRDFDRQQRKNLRQLLDSLDMELLGLNPTSLDLNLASTNPGILDETVVQVKELIDLARDLGAQVLEVTGGRVHFLLPPPYQDSWNTAKGSITECVEYAEKKGVLIALENVPGRFLGTAREMQRMIREVGSDHLKIMYDVANGNLVQGEEPVTQTLKDVADYLIYVHLSDNDGAKLGHLPVGEGSIDYGVVAQTLREIGFTGVSVIETEYPEDPDRSFADTIRALEPFGWTV